MQIHTLFIISLHRATMNAPPRHELYVLDDGEKPYMTSAIVHIIDSPDLDLL